MQRLAGRVAVVTGAGRGLGRAHALYLADQGAAVVVNDLGAGVHGDGVDGSPATHVADEITARGGRAVASGHDVSDWDQAEAVIRLAVETFGDLHVLVNNAGILRDRTLANMAEDDWDAVIRVHLKGHAAPARHAMAYWRDRAKAGADVRASVVMTASVAGYSGNFGQANYSAAKLAVVALSRVVALEGAKYGVRSNAVSPGARTRMAEQMNDSLPEPVDGEFDAYDPSNVSALIAWLAEASCPASSQVFHISGGTLVVSSMPPLLQKLTLDRRWTANDFDRRLTQHLVTPAGIDDWF